jgi:hypothetical protein
MESMSEEQRWSSKILILFGLLVLWNSSVMHAGDGSRTYWVSPMGTATWEDCESATLLDGSACCSLGTANSKLVAGDTVVLRGGVYSQGISPSNSGTAINNRIVYSAAAGETPVLTGAGLWGIVLSGRNWIKVHGITAQAPAARLLLINNGSSYNEISNCVIRGVGSEDKPMIWSAGTPVTHNWIHSSIFENTGDLYWTGSIVNDGGGLYLGVWSHDHRSNNNTFENNIFRCGGHHSLETYTRYNVIRNNFFHNEGCMPNNTGKTAEYGPDVNGLWGNRNVQIMGGGGELRYFNLWEGNRFGPSGPPPDDDGGDGLTLTSPGNIIRYNEIYGAQNNGILMKNYSESRSNDNRIYNNTVYTSGRYSNSGPQWQGHGLRFSPQDLFSQGNTIKNNIFYLSGGRDVAHSTRSTGNTKDYNNLICNWCTGEASAGDPDACTQYGDPMFVDGRIDIFPASRKSPDLTLQPSSLAIDAGMHLTSAKGAGSSSSRLVVEDALYFQDGSLGSALANHEADSIAIGKVDNVVQISYVDYSTNTMTLARGMTWSDGDRIWLYKKSDGQRVLYGNAPDLGAHEATTTPTPVPPLSLRVVQ